MFRTVMLPKRIAGQLYLHSMPGRYDLWKEFFSEAKKGGVNLVVSLAPEDEIKEKSPDYWKAIEANRLPCSRKSIPIPDYGIPDNKEDFVVRTEKVGQLLSDGDSVLIHCGAGVGRTGIVAICILVSLGMSLKESELAVKTAGSGPETDKQRSFISWYATH